MERKIGRTITTLEGEITRFLAMNLSGGYEYGLYDAEIDDIIITKKVDVGKMMDLESSIKELSRIKNIFNNKIKEIVSEDKK